MTDTIKPVDTATPEEIYEIDDFPKPHTLSSINVYLARVFMDIVNSDSVIFAFETKWLFDALHAYGITRTKLMDAEKCTFAEALNKLHDWKEKEDKDSKCEKEAFLKHVYESLERAVLGVRKERRCSKFEASILAAFEYVVLSDRVEIFNPVMGEMHFNKEEIIYLDRGKECTRSISKYDYRNISHAARMVNSRFIYVPHIIHCFLKRTEPNDLKRLLSYLYPSSLPNGSLNRTTATKNPTAEALYEWLNSHSVTPFIYRVIAEQLFGNGNTNIDADPENSLIDGPMLIMKLRTSHKLVGKEMKSIPDFIKIPLVKQEPSDENQDDGSIAKQVMLALKLWLTRLNRVTSNFDIHIDHEAESNFMLHTFHKNIFDAMILGSVVQKIQIDALNHSLHVNVNSRNLFTDDEDEGAGKSFSFSIPMTPGQLVLYSAVLFATVKNRHAMLQWKGLRVETLLPPKKDKVSLSKSTVTQLKSQESENEESIKAKQIEKCDKEAREIFQNTCKLLGTTVSAKSLCTSCSEINKRITQCRLLKDKQNFLIISCDKFWRIDIPDEVKVEVITPDGKEVEAKENIMDLLKIICKAK